MFRDHIMDQTSFFIGGHKLPKNELSAFAIAVPRRGIIQSYTRQKTTLERLTQKERGSFTEPIELVSVWYRDVCKEKILFESKRQ